MKRTLSLILMLILIVALLPKQAAEEAVARAISAAGRPFLTSVPGRTRNAAAVQSTADRP